jgi:phosphoglycerate dehydrogenase-like enzyme
VNSLLVMSPEHRDLIYGPPEWSALEHGATFLHPHVSPIEFATGGARFDDIEALFTTWGMPPLDDALLRRLPQLRIVFYAAGTVRDVVTPASWRRGTRVTTAAIANAQPVVEFTVAAIVFALKRVWERAAALRDDHRYLRHQPALPGCYGTTVGLIALGRIGSRVAERLRTMDVHVIGHDPFVTPADAARLAVRWVGLEELFSTADVVSCHLPLHAGTRHLIDGRHLRSMKRGTTFINTARGAVVNEADLVAVLRERPDLYALLDTITDEPPPPDCPLLRLPNAIVTPHLAGSMGPECRRMGAMMVDELRRYRTGEPLLGEVREADLARLA